MPATPGNRHSAEDRPSHGKKSGDRKIEHEPRFMKEDKIEHLAEVVVNAGSDYIIRTTEQRFGPNEVAKGPEALVKGVNPLEVAESVMKHAVRELERQEAGKFGHTEKGGLAASAALVFAHKDDEKHPSYAVAKRVGERFANVEKLAELNSSMFVGVNPDAGKDGSNAKNRHYAGTVTGHYITGTTRHDKNPDVIH